MERGMAMFCNNCGKEVKQGETFCTNCGSPIPQAGVQQSQGMQQSTQGKKPMSQGLKIALISILSAAVVGFGVFAYFQWIKPDSGIPSGNINGTPTGSSPVDTPHAPSPSQTDTGGFFPTATPATQTEANRKILGAWEWASEIVYYGLEFYDDGSVLYVEDDYQELYTYSISDNTLTMTDSYGTSYDVSFSFETAYGDEYLVITSESESLDFVHVDTLWLPTP